jgi:hypothetical protein
MPVAGKIRSRSTTSISPAPRHRPCRAAYWLGALLLPPGLASAHEPHALPPDYPDTPAFSGHIEQVDVASGRYGFKELFAIGGDLFSAELNHCEGSLTIHKGADTYEFDGATKPGKWTDPENYERLMSSLMERSKR